MINKALNFATVCHSNQYRKATKLPFIVHPMEAGVLATNLLLKDGEFDEAVVAAAILHDVCEDSFVSFATIEEIFGEEVKDLVISQTEDKSKTWQERKQSTIDFLKVNDNKKVEIITLADKLANMRSIDRDYKKLGEDLWERFNVKDKARHKWYYKSIGESIKFLKTTAEYKEYVNLVEGVFGK